MLKKIAASFSLAFHNIRSHFFHTVLSVLGIVIGVAALVAILSLIDGMEQFARDQIATTTNLKATMIRTEQFRYVDGIAIKKDSVTVLGYDDYLSLSDELADDAEAQIFSVANREIHLEGDTTRKTKGALVSATDHIDSLQLLVFGRKFKEEDLETKTPVAVINESLAHSLTKDDLRSLVGKKMEVDNRSLTVIGIVNRKGIKQNMLFFPFTLLTDEERRANPPSCVAEAKNVEDVPAVKDKVSAWATKRFGTAHDLIVATNDMRVQQAAKGFQLFRIIMGLIVGISVLVGGIGVMNVLLISVTERTMEIGIRKAVGANKRDIILQFLSESITVSMFGSFVGLVTGVAATMIFVPLIKAITHVPFQAAYTWNTFVVIAVLAVAVGMIFGTYPAVRAANLDPVEAIRRE